MKLGFRASLRVLPLQTTLHSHSPASISVCSANIGSRAANSATTFSKRNFSYTSSRRKETEWKMTSSKLQQWFPGVQDPMICNGPMAGVATPRLAADVSLAGGLGFLPCVWDLTPDSAHLRDLDAYLSEARQALGAEAEDSSGRLRIGAGFLGLHPSFSSFSSTALSVLQRHKPSAVWLFAPQTSPSPDLSSMIKSVKTGISPAPRVFVQVGNVEAAREALRAGADVLVAQGIDAGGHQFRRGMGVISLVPEVKDLIDEEGKADEVVVMAAGGIVCGKGVAAALALGAEGVVMGTKFAVAEESNWAGFRKELVFKTSDGGSNTLKSNFNDDIAESKIWGALYDGRAIISPIHEKFLAGASTEECLKMLKEEYSSEEQNKLIKTWAGTGVGRVNTGGKSGEIVREVREEALKTMKAMAERF